MQAKHTPTSVINLQKPWWANQNPQHSRPIPSPNPYSPQLSGFPPALHFDRSVFSEPYRNSTNTKRPILQPVRLRQSFQSDTSTLVLPACPYASLHKPDSGQEYIFPRAKRYTQLLHHIQFTILTVYRRLFTLTILLNLLPLPYILHQQPTNLYTLATCASTNFLLAILIRQDFAINAIFRTAWLVPWRAPLQLRLWVARCYCYGGIHSGCSVAGTLWFLAFSVLISVRSSQAGIYSMSLLAMAWGIMALLVGIVVCTLPWVRKRYHNAFEISHRFLGWASILLFWVQLITLTRHTSESTDYTTVALFVRNPTFWNLALITGLLIYSWLRLRRWTFSVHVLSSHAIQLRFKNPVHKFSCLSISTSPLREWHPFATFPIFGVSWSRERLHGSDVTDRRGDSEERVNSIIMSDAGDWTSNIIHQVHHLSHLPYPLLLHHPTNENCVEKHASPNMQCEMRFWIRSSPKAGVLSLSCIFKRVVLVTTGSGIGPCLGSLMDRPSIQTARLIWSTRSPMQTYGRDLCVEVLRAEPGVIIIDTDGMGRPDLVSVAWYEARRLNAEAVFVLSNEKVTQRVVFALRARGVPTFGPIWDS